MVDLNQYSILIQNKGVDLYNNKTILNRFETINIEDVNDRWLDKIIHKKTDCQLDAGKTYRTALRGVNLQTK